MTSSRAEAAAWSSPFSPKLLLTMHTTREAEQLLPRTAQQGHAAGGPAENALSSLSLPPLGMSPVQTPGRDGEEPWKTGFVPGGTRPSRPSLKEGGSQHSFPRRSREGQGQSQSVLRSSEALKQSLHSCISQKRNTSSASIARCLAPKFQASTSPVTSASPDYVCFK